MVQNFRSKIHSTDLLKYIVMSSWKVKSEARLYSSLEHCEKSLAGLGILERFSEVDKIGRVALGPSESALQCLEQSSIQSCIHSELH